ncbi:hypothetical protein Tco_0668478 [Tanacetum coccineum]
MQQPMQNPKDISDPTTALDMALELMSKAFQLNNITPTNNNQRSSSNPCYSQIAQSGMNIDQDTPMLMVDDNVGNQFRENAVQNVGHLDGQHAVQNLAAQDEGNANGNNGNQIRCYNCQGEDHLACNCTVKPGKHDVAYLQKQMQIALKEEAGIQLTQEEFDFMADAGAYEEIERVNANCTLKDNLQQASTSDTQTDKAPVYDSDELAEQAQQKQQSLYNGKVLLEKHDPPVVYDSEETLELAQEKADESLAKHKALELEIGRLLRADVSQDIMSIVQNNSVCEECKYDKISYDKAYNDMQQKIKRLQALLGDQKGKSKDTPCVSNTLDPLPQKLENEIVELEFQVWNYEKENAYLKIRYKNLFDSIKAIRAQTKAIIDFLQDKLHDTIYENAKLRAQLFNKVSEQKDTNKGTSVNTQFSKQSILGKPPSSSKPKLYFVTPFPKSTVIPKVGIFRINPFKASREDVNSNGNGFSPNNVKSTTRTRRPQPRNNHKSNKVPFKSKSSCLSNKLEKIEENHKSLQSSNYPDHMSSECNNIKLAIRNKKSEVICATCKQCLITANHDDCVLQYVNGMKSRKKIQSANVSKSANQKKHKPIVWKPKRVGSKERLASPKPSTPRSCLRWSLAGRMFDLKGKIIATSESVCQFDCYKGDNACTSNPHELIKRFPSSTFSMTGCQNWLDTLLIPLLFEYKPKDK